MIYCCSISQSCPILCDTMDCSTPGFPGLHHTPELAQTHVHGGGDAIQPIHPLSSHSLPAFNLSQHLSQLFTSGGQNIGASASSPVLPLNIQNLFPLGLTQSPCSPKDSQESSHQVTKILELWLNRQSLREYSELISFRIDSISLQSKGLSRVFSSTIVQKHQFFSSQSSLKSKAHIHTWLLEKS